MARNRVELDANFVLLVEQEASGRVTGRLRAPRRRRTTLQEVAEDIIETAKRLADEPPRLAGTRNAGGLPHTVGGRRRAGSPFRRGAAPGTPTYRSSFDAQVKTQNGKLVVEAVNTSGHADDVEFGTTHRGRKIGVGRTMALKITKATYEKLQRNRNLPRKKRRELGWQSASKEYRQQERKRAKQISKRRGAARANEGGVTYTNTRGRSGQRRFPTKFGPGDYRYITTEGVKTYSTYGILRRAMRSVAIRKLG